MPPPWINPDLPSLALKLLNAPQAPKSHPTPRRIRILFNGVYIADTCSSSSPSSARFLWEIPYYPYYYLPWSAFPSRPSKAKESSTTDEVQWKMLQEVKQDQKPDRANGGETSGDEVAARIWEVRVGDKSTDRVLEYVHGGPDGSLAGLVRFEFGAADLWLEEDTPIQLHPKDPFKRIDTLTSLRPIKISVPTSSGKHTTVAESPASVHLYETSLPTRYYIPFTTIDPTVLRPSELRTKCPYKGEAEYYDVVLRDKDGNEEVKKNLVWYYRAPLVECAAVAGMACFYNEKVRLEVGGVVEVLDGKSPFA